MLLSHITFLGILRHKVTCSSDDVVDFVHKQMVEHLMDNLVVKFKYPWKTMNSSLPWQQDGLVELRNGSPSFPN